ncbi:PRC-barrel domain-containing protein [Pirellulaceae bacterium SH449]
MKISKIWIASVMTVAFSSTLVAQNPNVKPAQETATQNLQKLDTTTSGPGIRASKLMGMNIQNSKKEHVGQIKDIVVDPMSTRIQYVAVTYGGFLGLGNKMFAVPMQAIKVQQDPDNRDQVVLVLDVTKEQMNGAQGFDEANWPNFSDEKFSGELHRRYRVEDRWNNRGSRDGKVDVNIGRDGVEVNVDGKKK